MLNTSSQLRERELIEASPASANWKRSSGDAWERNPGEFSKYWMLMDGLTIFGAAIVATLYEKHTGLFVGVRSFWHGTLIPGSTTSQLLLMLSGFVIALIETSRRLNLYTPSRLSGFLTELRLTIEACVIAGLLLAGALYLIHGGAVPRSIVLLTLGIVMVALSVRRMLYRLHMYRNFERGIGVRNVLIVGTGPEAQAFRKQLSDLPHQGYSFKGFIELPSMTSRKFERESVVGTLASIFDVARRNFVDEIFIAEPCEATIVAELCDRAREASVDLRVIPDMHGSRGWNRHIEYVGQFPTISLHCRRFPELALMLKRALDVVLAALALIVLSPVLAAIAIAIKIDSRGPVLYISERIGKKGRVFGCVKFRTMVRDAEGLRSKILSMNERSSVLFKVKNDPRVTRIGRILRKYSLDEIPQFFNVLTGDMSIVGPRPPIAREVREYQLKHLRRLDVVPGITGLWQVNGREDPSFDSYIMFDLAYIENWSVWLDLKIIARTVTVVIAGTGS